VLNSILVPDWFRRASLSVVEGSGAVSVTTGVLTRTSPWQLGFHSNSSSISQISQISQISRRFIREKWVLGPQHCAFLQAPTAFPI
jgi:hypothetical protein